MKARRFLLVAVVLGALAVVSSAFAMSAHSSKASTTIGTKKTRLGTILVTSSGRTLYLDKADKQGHPACKGACLSIWPPLKANGTLKASGSAKKSDLGTIKISGGIKQVTYKGHPLYTFKSDTRAGETNGEGVAGFFVVSPGGGMITKTAVKKSAPSAPTSPASGW